MIRSLVVLLGLALLFAAAPAQAQHPTWQETARAIWVTKWGGLCGNGLKWECERGDPNSIGTFPSVTTPGNTIAYQGHFWYDWTAVTGARSRWVEGAYLEDAPYPLRAGPRRCHVLTRFYRFPSGRIALAEVAYSELTDGRPGCAGVALVRPR